MWITSELGRPAFCIFVDTICQGPIPIEHDNEGNFIVYDTELEAQREIVDWLTQRLEQFLRGEREYQDAITVEDYVVPVHVYPDGTIVDADGNVFSTGRQ